MPQTIIKTIWGLRLRMLLGEVNDQTYILEFSRITEGEARGERSQTDHFLNYCNIKSVG